MNSAFASTICLDSLTGSAAISAARHLQTYLAAGGVQGLRPLRYEKRVARNRFIALVIFLFAILVGIISLYVHSH